MFIVEVTTRDGKACERFETYEEARRRVAQIPAETLVGIPFIFQELADGSQRLVREDGKPLQWHRQCDDAEPPADADAPLPLSDVPSGFHIEPLHRTNEMEDIPLLDLDEAE